MSSHLLSPLLIFSFAFSVIAEDISSATHFEASEMQRAGEQLQRRTVDLTANQRKLLLADLATHEAPEDESQKAMRSRIAAENVQLPYVVFVELLRSPIILQEFRDHRDPLVRFRVNLRLAATGDVQSAKLLCSLFNDESISEFDARAIKTMLLDIGIQPISATPDAIIEHLQTLQSGREKLKPGELIADLESIDSEGRTFKLSDFQGKSVFIHFWATNCVPCMKQMPELREKIAKLDSDRIEVVFVSLDYDKEAFSKAVESLKIPCRHVCDELSVGGALAKHFHIDRMPVDIIIDKEGKFVSYSFSSIERTTLD